MNRLKPNDFGKFLLVCVIVALAAALQLRARSDPAPHRLPAVSASIIAQIDEKAPLLTLPTAPKPVHFNVAWGECASHLFQPPFCSDTCPDGSCASCYQLIDGTWACCCPLGP